MRKGKECGDSSHREKGSSADAGSPFSPRLDEVMVTTSLGKSDYNGLTLGLRKRLARGRDGRPNRPHPALAS